MPSDRANTTNVLSDKADFVRHTCGPLLGKTHTTQASSVVSAIMFLSQCFPKFHEYLAKVTRCFFHPQTVGTWNVWCVRLHHTARAQLYIALKLHGGDYCNDITSAAGPSSAEADRIQVRRCWLHTSAWSRDNVIVMLQSDIMWSKNGCNIGSDEGKNQ